MSEQFTSNADGTSGHKEMSFLDHLEELRWHIVKIFIGWLLATAACGVFAEYIVYNLLLTPLEQVGLEAQVLAPYGIVLLFMQSVLICGFIISMPNTLYWLWRFIAPGLLPKERKHVSLLVAFTTLCFLAGVAFGYFVLIPTALDFFAGFGTDKIALNISIDRYISFVLALLVGAGLVFELPMVSYTLSKIGILTPAFMRHYRRHAIVAILIIAALVTPSPDIITQLLLGVPMFLLYELSILISSVVNKRRDAELAADLPDPESSEEPQL
ncbi:MAG TPA: twin-arginine translocase subunit TatC [Bacteroidota bacterium]